MDIDNNHTGLFSGGNVGEFIFSGDIYDTKEEARKEMRQKIERCISESEDIVLYYKEIAKEL